MDLACRRSRLEGNRRRCQASLGALVLARRADGACVYLGESNQCRIHEYFGESSKPLMCRSFPFGFSRVGERVAVDVSFACRSVAEQVGRDVAARKAEWSRLLDGVESTSTGHRFSKKYVVDSDLLWELEGTLIELLSDETMTSVDRLRVVSEFMKLATTSDPATPTAQTLRTIMAQELPKQIRERPATGSMDRTQRAVFFHLLYLSLNPAPWTLRAASGKARAKMVEFRVRAADAYKFTDAHPWIDNCEVGTSFGAVASTGAAYFGTTAGASLVQRYLTAKITGQRFLREGESQLSFLDAVPRLLLQFPMLIWTSKALAAERGESEAAEVDAERALRFLDSNYGQIRISDLPAQHRKAWHFILMETELPLCASLEMLRGPSERGV